MEYIILLSFARYHACNEAYNKQVEENDVGFKAGACSADLTRVVSAYHAKQTENFRADKGAHDIIILGEKTDEVFVYAHDIFVNPCAHKDNQRYNID